MNEDEKVMSQGININTEFEPIVPWNGAHDTGFDARMKLERNFKRVKDAIALILQYIDDSVGGLEDKFLRKDQEDLTNFLLKFLGGAIFGKDGYAEGPAGFGAKIDENGFGEMRGLKLWESLTVPQINYNRVDVIVGDKWRSPGAGVIDTVTPDTDAEGNILSTGTCTLKLEDGEYGKIDIDDINMGIWHFGDERDATEDSDDGMGNFTLAGFATAYFRVTEVSGVNNATFKYALRPGYNIHPQPQMTFSCRGNFTNERRQTSVYETRTYTRMLVNQNDWEIGKHNIGLQYGDLSNLSIFGLNMKGISLYVNSVYFTGIFKQVKSDGTPVITANDRGAYKYGERYYYYDRVSHSGCLWLCVDENEEGITSEPSKDNPSWLLQVDKGQDATEPSQALVVDADNQNIVVSADKDGNVVAGLPSSVNINAYLGNEKIDITRIELSQTEEVTASVSGSIITVSKYLSSDDIVKFSAKVVVTINDVEYSRNLALSVTRVRAGEDGVVPPIYEIVTSANIIQVDKNGNKTPTELYCSIRKTDANGSTIVSLPSGYSLKYSVDGGTEHDWSFSFVFYTNSVTKNVVLTLYKGSVIIDREEIPVLYDGTDGQDGAPGQDGKDAVTVDLSNEMISVPCDSSGKPLTTEKYITAVNVFYGNKAVSIGPDNITYYSPDGYTLAKPGSNGLWFSPTEIKASDPDNTYIDINVSFVYNGVSYTRSVRWYINKIKAGADGAVADLYAIQTSVSSIKVDKEGNKTPSTIGISILQYTADGITEWQSLPDETRLQLSIDGGDWMDYSFSNVLQTSSINQQLKIWLSKTDGTTLDKETIPVVYDGTDGAPGKPGEPGSPGEPGQYTKVMYKWSYLQPAKPTTLNPSEWSTDPTRPEDDVTNVALLAGGDFVNEDGWFRSPLTTDPSESYVSRIIFSTLKADVKLRIQASVSSESNYDCGYISKLDTAHSTSNYTYKKSGINLSTVEIDVPTPGEHFIEIAYTKDGSGDTNEDMFKVLVEGEAINCWMTQTVVTPPSADVSWTEPRIMPTDTRSYEQVYIRYKEEISLTLPTSNAFSDEFIGEAPVFVPRKTYNRGNVVKYNDGYKVFLRGCFLESPTDDDWDDIEWWSDNPRGISPTYKYEYMCSRKWENNKWTDYKNYALFARYGEDGSAADSAYPRLRGPYDSTSEYYYTTDYRDCVDWNGGRHRVKNLGTVPAGIDPSNTNYWEEASWQSFAAATTFLADNGNLGGLMFRKTGTTAEGVPVGELRSQKNNATGDPMLYMNTDTGRFECEDAKIRGEVNATSGTFTGTVYANDGIFKGNINIGDGKNVINKEGSGSLANGNITWDKDGNMEFDGTVLFGGARFSVKTLSNGGYLYYMQSDAIIGNQMLIVSQSDNDMVALPKGRKWNGVLLFVYNASNTFGLKIFLSGTPSKVIPKRGVGVFWGYSFNTDTTLWTQISITESANLIGVDETGIS